MNTLETVALNFALKFIAHEVEEWWNGKIKNSKAKKEMAMEKAKKVCEVNEIPYTEKVETNISRQLEIIVAETFNRDRK